MISKPVIIITGAAGSIGSAIAKKFAINGFAIVITDNDNEKLNRLKKEIDTYCPDVLSFTGDIQDITFIEGIINAVNKQWGKIDVLINNAAWRTRETLRTISPENWEKTIRVCLTAPAFFTRYAAAVMEKNNKGIIINISSIQSSLAGGGSPAYTACKGALESLTYESAVLYGPQGIRVVAVNPGYIITDLSADLENESGDNVSELFNADMMVNTPLKRGGNASEVAAVIYWLSSDEASFITGTSITVDGGFTHNFNSYSLKKIQFPKEF